jgi:N-acetylneuraminic acid mutarotase
MPNRPTYLEPVSLSVVLLMLTCAVLPMGSLGASWQMKEDQDFKTTGYVSNGIIVQDKQLQLGYQDQARYQKNWIGGPGQKEVLDGTKFLSQSNIDSSNNNEIKLDKESWVRLKDAPTAREEHVAVYDATSKKMIVYGGLNGTSALSSTWAYSPSTDTWTQLADAPVGRYSASGSYNTVNSGLLVHGGVSVTGSIKKSYNDTYLYDPASDSWTQKANETQKRYGQSSVFDPLVQRHFVFGGYSDTGESKVLQAYEPIGDTWEPKTSSSTAVYEQTAVWADSMSKMLVFGGQKPAGIFSKDLWAYNPETNKWSVLAVGKTEVTGHAAAWNPETDQMIVVGGHVGQTVYNDTWIYDSATDTWYDGRPLPGQPRSGPTLVWAPDVKMMILYGGKGASGDLSEVWGFSPYYLKTGELVSSSFDMTGSSKLLNLSWVQDTAPSGCSGASVRMQLAGSFTLDDSSYIFGGPDGPTSYYSNGQPISSDLAGKKYLRYRALLSTTDVTCTPILKEVKIGYRSFLPVGDWTSGPFDTGSSNLALKGASYSYDDPSGTEIQVYLRSAYTSDMATTTSWELLTPRDTALKTQPRRFVQFKVQMSSTDPGRTPTVSFLQLDYNSLPQLLTSPVAPSSGGSGTEFTYKVVYIDTDGETPTNYKVYIDDIAHDMAPQDYDYKVGANFTFTTKLGPGEHTYDFEFSDGYNTTVAPASGDFKGPSVNDPPTAMLKAPIKANKGGKVTFDASASSDPDGKIKQYRFDFGDGTNSGWVDVAKITHAYKKTGTFKAKVTVKDAQGAETTSTEFSIKIEQTKGFLPAFGGGLMVCAVLAASLLSVVLSKGRRYR